MNLTNEQIDAAIAALEAQRPVQQPRELWVVLDRDGDYRAVSDSRERGESALASYGGGGFAPYRLVHMREVLP